MLKYLPAHLLNIEEPVEIDQVVDAMALDEITLQPGQEFNPEQYKLLLKCALKHNFTAWDQAILSIPSKEIKLAGAILAFKQKRLFLPGANLKGANLQRANLVGADLQFAILQDANLQRTDLRGANLKLAILEGANLQSANLRFATLQGATLQGANLKNTNLRDIVLEIDTRKMAKACGAIVDDPLDKVDAEAESRKVENLIEKLNQDLKAQKENYESRIEELAKSQHSIVMQEVKKYKDEWAAQSAAEEKKFDTAKTEYLKPIIEGLDDQQKKMFRFGVGCFILGIIVLVAAAGFIYYDLQACMDLFSSNLLAMDLFSASPEPNTLEIVIRSSRLLAGLLLLAALARYFYMLGKSFMHESVVSSERLHALNFSQFFMRAFPVPDSYKDRKDIFAEWNQERSSAFHSLKPYDIDPRLIEMLSAVSAIVRGDDKKSEGAKKE